MSECNPAEPLSTAETSWQVAYCRAVEMASFKGGFLMRTAHELRSPLNKIISLQQMVLEGLCDDIEEEHQFVADAYAASMKLLEYLDLMIWVSKLEMGRLQPQLQAVSLSETLIQVKELTQVQVSDRNLRLIVEPPAPDILLQADPAWLRNLLTILLELAVEGGDLGTLHLSTGRSGNDDTHVIWLADSRPTTPWQEPVELPSPPDFTLDDTLSTSLRMNLVQAMITGMQGQLAVVSATDDATQLQITLPLAASL
ncbi:MAG: HAMP domain-containing sensor histidine kinase [Cyanobacteria bacterium P01_H01_bin.152]